MVSPNEYSGKFSSDELRLEEEFILSLRSCLLPLRDRARFHLVKRVGTVCRYPLSCHFRDVKFNYKIYFPSSEREFASVMTKIAECLAPDRHFYTFKPWDFTLPFEPDSQIGQMIMLSKEPDIEMTVPD
ncbi:hypothetical protein ACLOJK_027275 [Asimina triloba]